MVCVNIYAVCAVYHIYTNQITNAPEQESLHTHTYIYILIYIYITIHIPQTHTHIYIYIINISYSIYHYIAYSILLYISKYIEVFKYRNGQHHVPCASIGHAGEQIQSGINDRSRASLLGTQTLICRCSWAWRAAQQSSMNKIDESENGLYHQISPKLGNWWWSKQLEGDHRQTFTARSKISKDLWFPGTADMSTGKWNTWIYHDLSTSISTGLPSGFVNKPSGFANSLASNYNMYVFQGTGWLVELLIENSIEQFAGGFQVIVPWSSAHAVIMVWVKV